MIWRLSAHWIPERAHSKCEEPHAMATLQEGPPHKWHNQNIRVSVRSKPSRPKGSTCLHWIFLPRPVVDTQHHRLRGLAELGRGVLRQKMRKCGDDVGLTVVVWKHVPTKFWEHLLQVYNDILYHGAVPRSWFSTLFNMLPKKMRQNKLLILGQQLTSVWSI